MLKDFKAFVMKGNVLDLAVAVIIGAAFGAIVTSMVNDIVMPPIGMTLTDDQIAAVLTYIRREWGQTGTPVDAAAVRAVRAETAGRARPWTNDELLGMLRRGGRGGN